MPPTRRARKRTPVYVLVDKHHAGRRPRMLAAPTPQPFPLHFTANLRKARQYADRKGPFKLLKTHPELKKILKATLLHR